MTKNIRIILIVIVTFLIVSIILYLISENKVLCKTEEVCMIDADNKIKVSKLKFNDDLKYDLISIEEKKIEKIEGLENHSELKNLDLSNNQINKMEGLESLNNLESLDLSNNQISKIEGLENLNSIEYIYMQDNPIDVIQNVEQVNSDKFITWYLPENTTKITKESYDYLKNNEKNAVFFVKEGANIHEEVSDKTINDLEIV